MRHIIIFLFFITALSSDLTDLYDSAIESFKNKANPPTKCLYVYNNFPVGTNYASTPTDFCYSCKTNVFNIASLNYDSKTGFSPQVRADAVWLSNVEMPQTEDSSSFVSTPNAFLQYPTIQKPFIEPPYLVPLNVIVLFDISSSNTQAQTLFSFFKKFTSIQYLYFLTFNHNPQEVLHRGKCTSQSISQLMKSLCKISYGGGTRYRDAFNKMIDDIQEDGLNKTETLDIFLVSDGDEIQNRKLLRKSLDRLSDYKIYVHSVDTGDGTWEDKLTEISCEQNGYYINLNQKSIDVLFNAFWLRASIKENQRIINGSVYSGRPDTKVILTELISDYDDVIFPKRSFGVIGVVVDENEAITDKETYISEPKVYARDLEIQKYVLRSYTGKMCGDEINPTQEEMNAIKLTLASIDNWYSSSSSTTEILCSIDGNDTLKVGKCINDGKCVENHPTNYYLKEKCSSPRIFTLIMAFLLLAFIL